MTLKAKSTWPSNKVIIIVIIYHHFLGETRYKKKKKQTKQKHNKTKQNTIVSNSEWNVDLSVANSDVFWICDTRKARKLSEFTQKGVWPMTF